LTIEADKRAHLDLQINLLAEREMTLVLKMLRDLSEHFELNRPNRSKELEAFMARTDVEDLAERLKQTLGPPGASNDDKPDVNRKSTAGSTERQDRRQGFP
jgi:uncharacterized membrane protein